MMKQNTAKKPLSQNAIRAEHSRIPLRKARAEIFLKSSLHFVHDIAH